MDLGTPRRLVATLLPPLLAVVLVGCATDEPADPASDTSGRPAYVALGDSYTSGAGMADLVLGAGQCAQSRLSYPYLVAAGLDADLVDVSCGGATTQNGTTPQTRPDGSRWPAQLDALSAATELVTVGVGINDFDFFHEVGAGCAVLARTDPTGSPCQDDPRTAEWPGLPDRIGARVAAYLRAVQAGAPEAEVVLVGYPQPVPARGTCPGLPLARGDYPFVRELLSAADRALREAARATDVRFVDVQAASAGHDVCAGEDAWVNGATPAPGVAAAYHPFADYHSEVARLVLAALG